MAILHKHVNSTTIGIGSSILKKRIPILGASSDWLCLICVTFGRKNVSHNTCIMGDSIIPLNCLVTYCDTVLFEFHCKARKHSQSNTAQAQFLMMADQSHLPLDVRIIKQYNIKYVATQQQLAAGDQYWASFSSDLYLILNARDNNLWQGLSLHNYAQDFKARIYLCMPYVSLPYAH